ncbi:CDP-diacylglycerol--serine O-phosphatidyltransferase [Paenibacillus sp. N1-5-1-14]|uniref:CDP-diacylglycerol--serine O-phosphatidyltransferase n=1 Tax=Paenibacillus radicibacter TaxID=2972488 RepID=UPI0021595966|nr:CDP-diacylglycerol--serine O-phosphatidyltransferase [Paenibacillus radicibacter]MCR8645825.1 CDP-diacylglycerol--serine O-phosphatidyltransferase [Paenibacillus radicibacter]
MIKKSLPSVFTIGNLFLGVLAIILVFNDHADRAAVLVIIAMLLDGLDGRVARALNVQSEFGKELDSLSDVISFGVAPAFIMYYVAFTELNPMLAWTVTAIFPICGAIRLARFNVVAGTPGYFIGMPIPAAGGILSTLALFHADVPAAVTVIATVLLSYLMVSRLKYPNFKKSGIPKAAIWFTPIVIGVAIFLALQFPTYISNGILVLLLLYALLGLKKNVDGVFTKLRRKKRSEKSEDVNQKLNF